MKAAIVIDSWKYEIFDRNLKQSGYDFEEAPTLAKGTRTLLVKTDNLTALGYVVQAANDEAAKTRKSKKH